MRWFLILSQIMIAAVDVAMWWRFVSRSGHVWRRRLFAALTTVSDLLPVASFVLELRSTDNTHAVLFAHMWLLTLYIISVLPRMVWYCFLPFAGRRRVRVAGIVCTVAAAAIPVYGVVEGRRHLVTEYVTITSERLPESFDGFRIVHFSDLHIGTMLDAEGETQALVEAVNRENPDMVIFSGDLITIRHTELDSARLKILQRIDAPYGIYSSIGNHDTGIYVKNKRALPDSVNRRILLEHERNLGWKVLDDTTVYVHRGGDSLAVSGVSFSEELYELRHSPDMGGVDVSAAFEGVPHEVYSIAVSHLPQLWDNILALGYGDLTLSGHVHGMQMNLHLPFADLSPARLFYRRWSGLYKSEDGKALYINDGTGYAGMFMRIGVRPEVTVITLRSGRQ